MKKLNLLRRLITPVLPVVFTIGIVSTSCGQDDRPGIFENTPTIQDDAKNYSTEYIVEGLTNPWGMVILADGSLLITEKEGKLIHAKNGTKTEIPGLPEVSSRGQGGLLDIVLHPNFESNQWVYFSYASEEGEGEGANTAIMRARFDGSKLSDQQVLYKASPNSKKGQHFGTRMAFDDEGYLYFSIGDRGDRDVNPQDITQDCGKVYRIHGDGTIPESNPFYNEEGAKKAIFSYGHRNPQGMFFHPEYKEIWVNEHGPQGGDEINIVQKGANFGWPLVSYGINYDNSQLTEITSKEGMEQPIYYWVPSIAPSGFGLVPGDVYPDWAGYLVVGSLKFQYLELLEMDGKEVVGRTKLLDGEGRLRNVTIGPDHYIYAAIEGKGIIKISPKN
ncbi:hypothetical protein GCM10007049_04190 [Echinicola pacifica]|uniref:Glucose/Sorbosone dehydrogenase domain-containing protein n=1 Tax=Echinicola pacifica TaxID=346377 RepID=A0A918UJP8_9BACT|nr:PQQ-dependent sugar dehydrogenase [Echinicola pacifica]GGZ15281.1 hypothetical protein GCM10007049_04190 [Echinicola pacifica]